MGTFILSCNNGHSGPLRCLKYEKQSLFYFVKIMKNKSCFISSKFPDSIAHNSVPHCDNGHAALNSLYANSRHHRWFATEHLYLSSDPASRITAFTCVTSTPLSLPNPQSSFCFLPILTSVFISPPYFSDLSICSRLISASHFAQPAKFIPISSHSQIRSYFSIRFFGSDHLLASHARLSFWPSRNIPSVFLPSSHPNISAQPASRTKAFTLAAYSPFSLPDPRNFFGISPSSQLFLSSFPSY